MRTARSFLAALAVCLQVGQAHSADWPQEPNAVLGVSLGAPLLDTQLEYCPESWPRAATGRACLDRLIGRYTSTYRLLRDPPNLGFYYEATINLHEGLIESVALRTKRSNFAALVDVLVTRYGPPHTRTQLPFKNSLGQQVEGTLNQWNGAAVSISAFEAITRADESEVVFMHQATATKKQAKQQKATSEAAGRL